jgi:DNA-binding transcriptional LysR family regulator
VSKILQHLEASIGYRLFERIGGRLVPTMEARLLYEDADRVFRELEVLGTLARTIGEKKIGLLRIGASPPVTHSLLPRALKRFLDDHPTVKIQLSALPKLEIAEALSIGAIDLAVTLSPILAPTVRSEALADVPVGVVMRADDPLAALATVGPADLAGRRLVSYGAGAEVSPALDRAFADAGLVRDPAIRITSSIAAAPLVVAGLGVALVDGLVAWHDFPGLVARPFAPRVAMRLSVGTDETRPLSRFFAPFVVAVRAEI